MKSKLSNGKIEIWLMTTIFNLIFTFSNFSYALTNAQPALSDDLQSVVFLRTEARDPSDGSETPAYCNATLVHPLILVTAAHCVRDAYVVKSFTAEVTVGKYKYVTKSDGTLVRIGYTTLIKEVKAAKFYFTQNLTTKINNQGLKVQIGPQDDLAVIVLGSAMNLPETVKMVPVISQQELQGLAPIATQYIPTVVSINPFADLNTMDTKRSATLNVFKWNSAGYFESTSAARVEEGDSGSPVQVRVGNVWKLVAVVKGQGSTFMGTFDVFSAINNKICDIGNQIGNAELKSKLCL